MKNNSQSAASSSNNLTEWDTFLLELLDMEERPLFRENIFAKGKKRIEILRLEITDKQLYDKISRSLTKLINKRNEVVRYKFSGYGFVYGLPKWFTVRGVLKKEYQEKLREHVNAQHQA